MLSLRDTLSMRRAIRSPIDPALAELLALRMHQLGQHVDCDLGELVQFLVVEPGDVLAKIDIELGFPILQNFVDGTYFGDPDFTPSFDWMLDHGRWFELAFILSDDGYGVIVFVQDDPGVEGDVHGLCLEHANRPL